jgi:hypothetical protein
MEASMRRRYTDFDDEPHGTREIVKYYIQDCPDTRRTYGRTMLRDLVQNCPRCLATDQQNTRINRIRRAYARRR